MHGTSLCDSYHNSIVKWHLSVCVMMRLYVPTEKEVVASPYETKSDSFYFVDGELVMHHKAEYAYNAGH